MPKASVLHGSHHYYVAGGSDRYFLELEQLLTANGHAVMPFCAADPRNLPSRYEQYFPKALDTGAPRVTDIGRYIWSRAARKSIKRLITEQRPDLAHLHIYYGKLTSSILGPLRQQGIPVVQTLHEYKLLCPVYTCIRDADICEACAGKHFWKAARYRCNRGSTARSVASALEAYVSRAAGADDIDHFIGVSRFMTDKMQQIGIPADRISTVHNFVDTTRFAAATAPGSYVLYFGRLERTKGLFTLLDALREHPDLRCVIAGTGPASTELQRVAEDYGLANVEFPGFVSGTALHELVRGATCTVLPSEWYENCPMSLLESLAFARPVIGARIGGIPELIEHEQDGLLFDPGNAEQLAEALARIGRNAVTAVEMGMAGLEKVRRDFSPAVHYEQISAIYTKLLN